MRKRGRKSFGPKQKRGLYNCNFSSQTKGDTKGCTKGKRGGCDEQKEVVEVRKKKPDQKKMRKYGVRVSYLSPTSYST